VPNVLLTTRLVLFISKVIKSQYNESPLYMWQYKQ